MRLPGGSTGNTEDDYSSSSGVEYTKEELIRLDRDLRLGLGLAVRTACLAQDHQRPSQCMPRHNGLVPPGEVQPPSHVILGVQAKA